MRSVTSAQMKAIEKKAVEEKNMSYYELMQNAGIGSARKIIEKFYVVNKNIVVLCGSGNNAGDGFVIAKHLYIRGANVTVVLCKGQPKTDESKKSLSELKSENLEIINANEDMQLIVSRLKDADFIVDCIFGTGFSGSITSITRQIVDRANLSDAVKISIDLPSGINADTGEYQGIYFKSNYTIVLGLKKRAHELDISKDICGEQILVDIGLPIDVIDDVDLEYTEITNDMVVNLLPKREKNSHKGDYGKLLNIAGSVGMGGASMMSTKSALRCGCGLTTLATPKSVAFMAFPHIMEAMTVPLKETDVGSISSDNLIPLKKLQENCDVITLGCGISQNKETQSLVKDFIAIANKPMVIDADALNAISNSVDILNTMRNTVIITPHSVEMARLANLSLKEVEDKRERVAHEFAKKYNVIVVLKGCNTVVALPDGDIFINTTGTPALAKGGSGDVLTGMIGSFLAQGVSPKDACIISVYIHGLAGQKCEEKLSVYSVTASDLIEQIPLVLREMQNQIKKIHQEQEKKEEIIDDEYSKRSLVDDVNAIFGDLKF